MKIKTRKAEVGKIKKVYNRKKRKNFFKIGENEKQIIAMVGLGLLVIGSLALPNLPIAFKPFLEEHEESEIQKILKRLFEKKVINLGGEEITLTSKGKKLFQVIHLEGIKIRKPKHWDRVWKLVAYDIPDKKKKAREWFRQQLERLDFEMIQESLWVFPYECQEEIAVIAKDLEIADHVIYRYHILKTH